MWELVKAGGWLMLPLVLCSIFMLAISIERLIRLKKNAVLPFDTVDGAFAKYSTSHAKNESKCGLKAKHFGPGIYCRLCQQAAR